MLNLRFLPNGPHSWDIISTIAVAIYATSLLRSSSLTDAYINAAATACHSNYGLPPPRRPEIHSFRFLPVGSQRDTDSIRSLIVVVVATASNVTSLVNINLSIVCRSLHTTVDHSVYRLSLPRRGDISVLRFLPNVSHVALLTRISPQLSFR